MRERSKFSSLLWSSALALIAGCGRLAFDPLASDAQRGDTSVDTVGTGAFGTPAPLLELQLGQRLADDPMLSLDERTILYTLEGTTTNGCDIYMATRDSIAMPFSAPAPLPGAVNGAVCDTTAAWSGDQLTLVYSVGSVDYDLFESTRASSGDLWPAGQLLGTVNSASPDLGPVLAGDGLRMAFYTQRDGTMDLYETTRATRASAWSAPVKLTELDDAVNDEDSPHLSSDGLTIWFVSNAGTSFDIYSATRPALNMGFGAAVRIDELASPFDEDDPWVSADGHRIYFARYTSPNEVQIVMASR